MHNIDISLDMLIKFSNQIGNSFTKIINTKVNSKPSQTAKMELFPQVATNFRGKIRILSTSKMVLFAKIVKNEKPFTIFVKNPILDVWQGSEYAPEWLPKLRMFHFKINLNIKGNR